MNSIRRWRKNNPSTPKGRRASRVGLIRTSQRASTQMAGVGGRIVDDIRTLAHSYGMGYPRVFKSKTSGEWQKMLLHYHTSEELLHLPMIETGINASIVLVVSCGDEDDICSMLLGRPDSRWLQDLGRRVWGDDPNKKVKLQLATNLIRDEILKRIKQFGFKLGDLLMYEDQTKTGIPLIFLPLYSKQDLT